MGSLMTRHAEVSSIPLMVRFLDCKNTTDTVDLISASGHLRSQDLVSGGAGMA